VLNLLSCQLFTRAVDVYRFRLRFFGLVDFDRLVVN